MDGHLIDEALFLNSLISLSRYRFAPGSLPLSDEESIMTAIKILASATLSLILLAGCTGPVIPEAVALENASEHLTSLNVPHEHRSSTTTLRDDVYEVVFHLPEGMLGGDFIVNVSAEDGTVLDVTLWR
jgi:hypothetical protein